MQPGNRQKKDTANFAFPTIKINWWSAAVVAVSIVGVYVLLHKLALLQGTFGVLRRTVFGWIVVSAVMTVAMFMTMAFAQYASGNGLGSYRKLAILQWTGAFIDHFLPFNAGSVSLTARYYVQLGMTKAQALTVALMPTAFGIITTVVLMAFISPLTLSHLAVHAYSSPILWSVACFLLFGASGAILLSARLRARIKFIVKRELSKVSKITLWPQLVQIVTSCVLHRLAGGAALACAAYAVHAQLSLVDAFTIFVTAQIVINLSPTPGGIGTTEAFMIVGLTSVGLSVPQATATTVVFRFVTFWLPLLPGMLALHRVHQWSAAKRSL